MPPDSQKSIWLDCDTGHDDAFAILLSAYYPQAKLLGISTVHGNAPLNHTTNNTLAVLEALGHESIEVVRGSPGPLDRAPSFAPDIHGETGLDGVTLLREPRIKPSKKTIEDVSTFLLSQPADSVHLVATGPLTNVARMLVAKPELARHLASLSVMGGAIGGGFTDAPLGTVKGHAERFGNTSPWAEFNIYADPEAAHTVFSNKVLAAKSFLIPLDLTHQVRGTDEIQQLLFGEGKWQEGTARGPRSLPLLRQLFKEILTFFSATYAAQFAITDGPPLHDPLAVWAGLRPDEFTESDTERWHVDVDLSAGKYHVNEDPQNHRGQTVLRKSEDNTGVRVPRGVNIPSFWQEIDTCLAKATDTSGYF